VPGDLVPDIKVARPLLPRAERLMPYVNSIDHNRWYSNWGPLVIELERRIARLLGVDPEEVVTVCNGTVGLTLGLMSHRVSPGDYCMMPSWTFTATPLAAVAAGLTPYFVDVDRESWATTPDIVMQELEKAPVPIAAIMPVAPFGQPLDGAAWDTLAKVTGIPVIIDAAAAVDTFKPTQALSMISLHATKLLGLGEGGVVVSRNRPLIADIRQRANFGFAGSRDTQIIALNAKLSEYGAAVGLAAIDAFAETRASFLRVAARYADRLGGRSDIRLQADFGRKWVSTTLNVLTPTCQATSLAGHLASHGIETRAWWGRGAHAHQAFAGFPKADLRNTEWLAEHTIGLPLSVDMADREVDEVCDTVLSHLTAARTSPASATLAV
jgi:dTDP-4-amino-4,6-dideoxygalactose transaminase